MNRTSTRPPKNFVPAAWFVRQLCNLGIGRSELAAQLRMLESQVFEQEELLLPTADFQRMLEWAATQLDGGDVGAKLARVMTINEMGLTGYIIKHSASLAETLENTVRYHRLFAWEAHYFLRETETELQLEYVPNIVTGVEPVQDILFVITLNVIGSRRALGEHWFPETVHLSFSEHQVEADLSQYLGDSIKYDQPVNMLAFPKSEKDAVIPDADPALLSVLKNQADPLIENLSRESDLIHSVRLLIASNLQDPSFGMPQVAHVLDTTVRQLHRELDRQGSAYKLIREQAVAELACEALSNSDDAIARIAGRLGYSESSAFSRLFVRLMGKTPSKYRREFRKTNSREG